MSGYHWLLLIVLVVGAYWVGRNKPLGLPYIG